jgi:hypothetical protein
MCSIHPGFVGFNIVYLVLLPTEHAAMILMHIDQASIESIGIVCKNIIGMLPLPDMRLVQPKPTALSFYSVVVITRPSHYRCVQIHDERTDEVLSSKLSKSYHFAVNWYTTMLFWIDIEQDK